MPFRNWLHIIALGGLIACFSVGVAFSQTQPKPVLERDPIATPNQQEGRSGTAEDARRKQEQTPDYSTALQRIESAIRNLIPAPDENKSQRQEQREIDDLQAQEGMAKWAFWMFVASTATVAITFVGLILIWRTLHHTRRAADYAKDMVIEARLTTQAAKATVAESEKAAEAANKQADIAQQALRGLERPYLFVKIINTEHLRHPDEASQPHVIYTLVNHGKTPATLRSISISLRYNPDFPLHITMAIDEQLYEVIEAGGGRLQEGRTLIVDDSTPGESFNSSNASLLVLHGMIVYEDQMENYYVDSVCLQGNAGGASFRLGGSEYNWRKSYKKEKPANLP